MKYVPCPDRRFPLKLEPVAARVHASYAYWLRHLVERLGSSAVRQLWNTAFTRYDHGFLERILSSGWSTLASPDTSDVTPEPSSAPGDCVGKGAPGMRASEASSLISETPPLHEFRARYPRLDVQRDTTAYEALHLYVHGLALLSETLIDTYGKQGELIAYDVLLSRRLAMGKRLGGTVAEFIRQSAEQFERPNMFAAGLDVETIHVSPTEYITRVKKCEWARYFRERHPGVAYLVACSTDEAFARGFNESLRLQRTSTIMEGAEVCDFRYYSLEESSDDSESKQTP